MRTVLGLFALAGAVSLQASAFADEPALAAEIPMPAITSADAAGEPEWYKRFSFTADDGAEFLLAPSPAESWGLSWTQGSRWLISIDRTRREAGLANFLPYPRDEVSAGAMFQISPRLSVGGELSVGADSLDAESLGQTDEAVEAGIRLRSAFKF